MYRQSQYRNWALRRIAGRHISKQEFAAWGRYRVAYVRKRIVGGKAVYSVYDSDGGRLDSANDLGAAFAQAENLHLMPLSVH